MRFEVKKIRDNMGLSLQELAEKSGVSEDLISKIESNRINTVGSKDLTKIATALGVPISDLFAS